MGDNIGDIGLHDRRTGAQKDLADRPVRVFKQALRARTVFPIELRSPTLAARPEWPGAHAAGGARTPDLWVGQRRMPRDTTPSTIAGRRMAQDA